MRKSTPLLTIFLFSLFAVSANALADTLHVGPGQTYPTIQEAVDAANPGDLVVVHDAIYVENVYVDKAITLRSQDYIDNGENDGAIIDAGGSDTAHGFHVAVDGVTVQGFSVHGAVGYTVDYDYRAAIYVGPITDCLIANNSTALSFDDNNSLGIVMDNCTDCLVEGNAVRWSLHGIWVEDCRDCVFQNNLLENNYYQPDSGGFFLVGNPDDDYNAKLLRNHFVGNTMVNNTIGFYFLSYAWNNTVVGNDIHGNSIGMYATSHCHYNLIAGNTIVDNTSRGFHFNGAHSNVISGNLIDNNHMGIYLGYEYPSDVGSDYCEISRNTIVNHSWVGIRISPNSNHNRMFLNHFADNLSNIISEGTDWNTPSAVSYFRGPNWRNHLGNYYDTYMGTDTDGDGVGDTDLPFDDGDPLTGPNEWFPLVESPDSYDVQAWYLNGEDPFFMYCRNEDGAPGLREIVSESSLLWISDTPAAEEMVFAEATWTGQIRIIEFPNPNTFSVEVGTSTGAGDFTPSGAIATIGEGFAIPFETSAAAVIVTEGEYLALRLTNLSLYYDYSVMTGATFSYLSSPGVDDPEWPVESTGVENPTPAIATLLQNYPNPFNPETVIAFELAEPGVVQLSIFDVQGRRVATLLDEPFAARAAHDDLAGPKRCGSSRQLRALSLPP